jgi:hypothetical protein
MPVEIRTADGRHWARPVAQLHAPLPLVRLVTPFERRRRTRTFAGFLILFLAVVTATALLAERLYHHG